MEALEPDGPAVPLEPDGPAVPLEPDGPAVPLEPDGPAVPDVPGSSGFMLFAFILRSCRPGPHALYWGIP
ncbi:hypothetical protein NtRootA4_27080 [Arthrobacter sp. NtRootA4]|nr:hypothetical protein NtRootA2_29270 [Arthrobacter sp. NtRootA2]BCW15729.1 hypothetical protein NtRootA4_27080 [Arthrobacter sp. NtRootA4]BCW24063.1 hypothetical protein NtRootC7_29300 [Arthrobacter sp. NtRootC7]BCW28331.1 hypothetical protein NtRootC45_29310 [Arthrobacter sp. NtRootC45]